MKRLLLLAMLVLMSMTLLGTNYIYATTPNQQNSEMTANTITLGELTTGVQQDVNNTTNIQNTTVRNLNEVQAVNNTNKNQSTSETVNSTSSSKNLNDSSNSTVKIQSATQAAGDEIYNNVHGLWLSVDDVKNVNANELKNVWNNRRIR